MAGIITDPGYLQQKHAAARNWQDYLAAGTPDQQANWKKIYDQVTLTDAQQQLIGSFVRQMNVIVLSGIWCGDCAQQCPILEKVAQASAGKINLRWADRDEHMDLQDQLVINGGKRVPVAIFAAEDYALAGWFGDRTLSRYRAIAKRQLGASCQLPGAPVADDELAQCTQDWVDQFERIHLMLRLSTRLRQKYND